MPTQLEEKIENHENRIVVLEKSKEKQDIHNAKVDEKQIRLDEKYTTILSIMSNNSKNLELMKESVNKININLAVENEVTNRNKKDLEKFSIGKIIACFVGILAIIDAISRML